MFTGALVATEKGGWEGERSPLIALRRRAKARLASGFRAIRLAKPMKPKKRRSTRLALLVSDRPPGASIHPAATRRSAPRRPTLPCTSFAVCTKPWLSALDKEAGGAGVEAGGERASGRGRDCSLRGRCRLRIVVAEAPSL
jgi:hypothetical protein